MPTDCITYQNSGYFTKLITDYLDQKPALQSLYHRFPSLGNFEEQILEKQSNFNNNHRANLVSVLQKQYNQVQTSDLTKQNIEALASPKSFTVTTGHQLNLFTGPLYFLYKIISTINLTVELKAKYPEYHFVPIYWMATEDHDFEEINYFNFKGKKIRWNTQSKGPVGRLSTEGLDKIIEVFSSELGAGTNANRIQKLFKDAYLTHNNLADATRHLANELFGHDGLVILDADQSDLKREFIPYIKEELLYKTAQKNVLKTTELLKEYKIQVNPREINLFYLEDDLRERIVFEDGIYKINNTSIHFSEKEILTLLENNPEKFSPNVIMRPLYQEVILPNLCYIGGGGEIAYWLELKAYFEKVNVTFPILLLRNSVLLVTEKQAKKTDKLALSWMDLFMKQIDLINLKVTKFSAFPIDLKAQKIALEQQFEYLKQIALQTDPSFLGAVKAQEAKQIRGLENLEKRLLKAQKRKHEDVLKRLTDLQNELFPNHSLQERIINFSEIFLNHPQIISSCFKKLEPLSNRFEIIVLR